MNIKRFVPVLLSLFVGGVQAQAIVPVPAKLKLESGIFRLSPKTRVIAHGPARDEAEKLIAYLRPATGFDLPLADKAGKGDEIALSIDPTLQSLGKEGYTLQVRRQGVQIKAATNAGLFYGIQSLRQLLPADVYRSAKVSTAWNVPALSIEDTPRFSWRGSHLDVSRHFMPKEFILKHLELMAQHKLNTFHWHLTDDQGWRIEIKKYPKLTSIGAWRKQTMQPPYSADEAKQIFDGKPHGGFYSQDDVREVVAFAAARHITVVPEIEMPGHALAAIAAYPELGNFPEVKHEVGTRWGVIKEVFNVEDHTQAFLKDVLDEVLTLFPSSFIHIGGDECPKDEWARTPSALARMKQLKLVSETTTLADLQNYHDASGKKVEHPALHQLQSWFVLQMDQYLAQKGRRLIGWDEILEGGLAPGAAVMSWRGEAGGVQAATQGHDVVMTPTSHTYFDYPQVDFSTPGYREPAASPWQFTVLSKVYGYEPIPAELAPEKAKHVLGSQGQIWTEYLPTPKHVEYMAWPRLAALAEVLWSPKSTRNFDDFKRRNVQNGARWEAQDVNYRRDNGPQWP